MAAESSGPPKVEDFNFEKPISKGAFGQVYLGHKKSKPDIKLAIKIMQKQHLQNKNMLARVQEEKNALAILEDNSHVVKLLYCLQNVDQVYLVMEYLVGGDLKSLLEVFGCFTDYMIAFYSAEIGLALNFLNKRQIIHRDVKPDNCLIDQSGHLKLTDFGLAKIQVIPNVDKILNNLQCGRTPGQIMSLKMNICKEKYTKKSGIAFLLSPLDVKEKEKTDVKFDLGSQNIPKSMISNHKLCRTFSQPSHMNSEKPKATALRRKRSIDFVSGSVDKQNFKCAALSDASELVPCKTDDASPEILAEINEMLENKQHETPPGAKLAGLILDQEKEKENEYPSRVSDVLDDAEKLLDSWRVNEIKEEMRSFRNLSISSLLNSTYSSTGGLNDESLLSLDGSYCEAKAESKEQTIWTSKPSLDIISVLEPRGSHDDSIELMRCNDSRLSIRDCESRMQRLSLVSFNLSPSEKISTARSISMSPDSELAKILPRLIADDQYERRGSEVQSGGSGDNPKVTLDVNQQQPRKVWTPSVKSWKSSPIPTTPFTPAATPYRVLRATACRSRRKAVRKGTTFSTERVLG